MILLQLEPTTTPRAGSTAGGAKTRDGAVVFRESPRKRVASPGLSYKVEERRFLGL
jgi:hypothetical protein